MNKMLKTISLIILIFAGQLNAAEGKMIIHDVIVGQLGVNCFIVSDGKSPDAIIIDPGDDYERIAEVVKKQGLRPKLIVFTHGHYDHICAARDLKDMYHIPVLMHEEDAVTYQRSKVLCVSWGLSADDFPSDYKTVKNGDRISAGSLSFEIIHTPGHTPGSICLHGNKTLFTGDTLFRGSVGRTDLPGGNTGQLRDSLKKLISLPPDTKVLCGHGDETTIGLEMKSNPFLNNKFKLMMEQ